MQLNVPVYDGTNKNDHTRLLHYIITAYSEASRAAANDSHQDTVLANTPDLTADTSVIEGVLRTGTWLSTAEIKSLANRLTGEDWSRTRTNSALYTLLRLGQAERTADAPPRWKAPQDESRAHPRPLSHQPQKYADHSIANDRLETPLIFDFNTIQVYVDFSDSDSPNDPYIHTDWNATQVKIFVNKRHPIIANKMESFDLHTALMFLATDGAMQYILARKTSAIDYGDIIQLRDELYRTLSRRSSLL